MEETVSVKWRKSITERCGGENFDEPGSGYSFSDVMEEEDKLDKLNQDGKPESALLKLSIADPTWKMRSFAMDMALRYYDNDPDATRYTDNRGIKNWGVEKGDTNVELAAYLNRRFADGPSAFNGDWVQYSPGSIKRALAEYLPTLLFDPNTVLIFPTPGYPVIKDPMNVRGANVEDSPLIMNDERWNIDFKSIGSSVLRPGFRHIMYVNIPHNPTGYGYTKADWKKLLDWSLMHRVLLIVDEAYIDLCYNNDVVSVLTVPGWEECCIVLQSVSKGYSATGLRFGWMVAKPIMIKAIRKVTNVKDSGLFGSTIAAGLTCLGYPKWAEGTRERYLQLHAILHEALTRAGFQTNFPDAGLCQFTPAPKEADGIKFTDAAECAKWFREKLRISLMHTTVHGDPWLRWAVTIKPVPECGLSDEMSVIDEAVRRIGNVKFTF